MESSLISFNTNQSMRFISNGISHCIAIILLFSFTQCTKVTTIQDHEPRAVVQGYLGAGDTISNLRVVQEISFGSTDTVATPIAGLKIKVSGNGTSIILHDADSGYYTAPMRIHEGQTYTLEFTYKGKLVTAMTTIPSRPTGYALSVHEIIRTPLGQGGGGFGGGGFTIPDPLELTWTNADQSFYLTAYQNIETSPEAINGGSVLFGRRFRLLFNEPTQGTSAQIQAFSFQYYGRHDILLMHVQPEYAALYQSNGSNSLNLDPPQTNISNGLGIFTGFAADTMLLLVRKP